MGLRDSAATTSAETPLSRAAGSACDGGIAAGSSVGDAVVRFPDGSVAGDWIALIAPDVRASIPADTGAPTLVPVMKLSARESGDSAALAPEDVPVITGADTPAAAIIIRLTSV